MNSKRKATYLKNLFLIFIILAFSSCNFLKLKKSPASVDEGAILFHSKTSISDSNEVARFESEDFVSEALKNYTIKTVQHEYLHNLKCTKESIVNMHDPAIIDTIYNFSNHKNKIQIYRAKHKDLIILFDVTDQIFKLSGDIKPGMAKNVFLRKFHIAETEKNKVNITNAEGSISFMFYFENNRLKRINGQIFLD